jgi:hypothetical protein
LYGGVIRKIQAVDGNKMEEHVIYLSVLFNSMEKKQILDFGMPVFLVARSVIF